MDQRIGDYGAFGGPVQMFYRPANAARLPTVARADGIYMWDTTGKRYIDASSGPVVSNLGHGNERVIAAADKQMREVAFASRMFFENQPNVDLAELVCRNAGPSLNRAYFISGGSEATETAIKLARQYAVAIGQASRWKVIGRNPGYHGGTAGAISVTGDPISGAVFDAIAKDMPKAPAPFSYRLPPNHDVETYAQSCASALQELIEREGPETVLAFIMEPVGGLATGALVATDSYHKRIRDICTRYGVLLIYDEVMSGAGRTGAFLAAHHWPDAMPDIVTLAKGIGAGYTPLGCVLAPDHMVDAVVAAGGFLHGFTYAANPVSCAIGVAAVRELLDRDLMGNAQAMGARLRKNLEEVKSRRRVLGDIRGKGLLMAIEIVSDKETKAMLPEKSRAIARIVELGMERGLLLYSRRTANGKYGEWLMVTPPLIVTEQQVDEISGLIDDTLKAFEGELAMAGI